MRAPFEVQLEAEEDLRLGVICEPLDDPLAAHLDVVVVLRTLRVRDRPSHPPDDPHLVAPLEGSTARRNRMDVVGSFRVVRLEGPHLNGAPRM